MTAGMEEASPVTETMEGVFPMTATTEAAFPAMMATEEASPATPGMEAECARRTSDQHTYEPVATDPGWVTGVPVRYA